MKFSMFLFNIRIGRKMATLLTYIVSYIKNFIFVAQSTVNVMYLNGACEK